MRPITDATKNLFRPLQIEDNDFLHLSLDDTQNRFIARTFSKIVRYDGDLVESFASYSARFRFFERFPERYSTNVYGQWLVPATDISVALIDALWPKNQLIFSGEEERTIFEYLRLTGKQKDALAERVANFRANGVVQAADSLHWSEEFPLAGYQQLGLQNSLGAEGYSLFMDKGTGKTAIVIARVCNESLLIDGMYRCLILCPKNVRMNWENEFVKFANVGGKVTVIRGNELERAKLLVDAMRKEDDCEYSVVVMSYDNLARTWSMFQMIEWDLAVLDESHYIKSPSTKRWKFAQKLRDRSKARMCLTGTPIANTPLDLYTQFEFLGKGWSGFSNWKAFRSFYGVFEDSGNGHERLVGCQNMPFLQERLARQSFVIRKEEALPDLPEKVYDVVEVEMSKKQREAYDSLATQLALEIENELDSDRPKQLLVNNVLTKLLRLAQITSGFITWDAVVDEDGRTLSPKAIEPFSPNCKLDGLLELLEGKGSNEKTIVWACWVHDILTIQKRLTEEGIGNVVYYGATSEKDREDAVWYFNNDPRVSVFVGNPVAGGTGLNLLGHPPGASEEDFPCCCNHEIFYSQNWSMTARSQSEDRAHRRGTRQNIRITDLCVPETIDEEIRMRVMDKHDTALRVSDIREMLNKLKEA